LFLYFLLGRVGFAAGLQLQVRSRKPCAAKLQKELPPVALLQQRHIGFRLCGLSAYALTPWMAKSLRLGDFARIYFTAYNFRASISII